MEMKKFFSNKKVNIKCTKTFRQYHHHNHRHRCRCRRHCEGRTFHSLDKKKLFKLNEHHTQNQKEKTTHIIWKHKTSISVP